MPRKMVRQNWGPIPARRPIQGKGADLLMDINDAANEDVVYEDSGPNDGGDIEKLATPQPNESFISQPGYCSTVGKTGKRFKGGGL